MHVVVQDKGKTVKRDVGRATKESGDRMASTGLIGGPFDKANITTIISNHPQSSSLARHVLMRV